MDKPSVIGCVIPINGRPGLVDKTIARLKRQTNCRIMVVCIGSEEQDRENIKGIKDMYFYLYRNSPLGAKWQFGIDILRNLNPNIDAYLHTGSDEWLTDNYCSVCMEALRGPDNEIGMVGVKGFYIASVNPDQPKKMIYWPGYLGERATEPLGAGRLISRETLDLLKWNLLDTSLETGLDASITKKVASVKKFKIIDNELIAVLGIKTNLWETKNNFDLLSKQSHQIPQLMLENFLDRNFPGIEEIEFPRPGDIKL